jgi:predicted nucleotidyltransferase component of viral defense system
MNDSDDEHRRMGQRRSLGEQRQVEQDLIISRAIIDLSADPLLREQLRFRGGTALNKLHFPAPIRYSEDIGDIWSERPLDQSVRYSTDSGKGWSRGSGVAISNQARLRRNSGFGRKRRTRLPRYV